MSALLRYGLYVHTDASESSEDFSTLPSQWVGFLPSGEDDVPDLDVIYGGPENVLPKRQYLFRAFHATLPERVRVVLLGQDPYPSAELADGLAFSQAGVTNNRSALHRLFLNLARDPKIQFDCPNTGDLTSWANQGVLLMNAALTVEEEAPKSHLGEWTRFSRTVLRTLADERRRIAFILLGGDAIDTALPALSKAPAGSIIRAAHPMAGDPGEERPFHLAHVFSEANAFLSNPPVNWASVNPDLAQ